MNYQFVPRERPLDTVITLLRQEDKIEMKHIQGAIDILVKQKEGLEQQLQDARSRDYKAIAFGIVGPGTLSVGTFGGGGVLCGILSQRGSWIDLYGSFYTTYRSCSGNCILPFRGGIDEKKGEKKN